MPWWFPNTWGVLEEFAAEVPAAERSGIEELVIDPSLARPLGARGAGDAELDLGIVLQNWRDRSSSRSRRRGQHQHQPRAAWWAQLGITRHSAPAPAALDGALRRCRCASARCRRLRAECIGLAINPAEKFELCRRPRLPAAPWLRHVLRLGDMRRADGRAPRRHGRPCRSEQHATLLGGAAPRRPARDPAIRSSWLSKRSRTRPIPRAPRWCVCRRLSISPMWPPITFRERLPCRARRASGPSVASAPCCDGPRASLSVSSPSSSSSMTRARRNRPSADGEAATSTAHLLDQRGESASRARLMRSGLAWRSAGDGERDRDIAPFQRRPRRCAAGFSSGRSRRERAADQDYGAMTRRRRGPVPAIIDPCALATSSRLQSRVCSSWPRRRSTCSICCPEHEQRGRRREGIPHMKISPSIVITGAGRRGPGARLPGPAWRCSAATPSASRQSPTALPRQGCDRRCGTGGRRRPSRNGAPG